MITGNAHIVFFSAVEFESFLSGRTRQLAEALARKGFAVTYVSMFGSVGKLRRQISGLLGKSTARANHGVRVLEIPPLVRPRGMVESGPGKIQARWLAARILERVPEISSSRVVVSSPLWAPVLRHLKLGRLCYDCIDHVEVFSGARHERLFQAWNSELMALCDVVSYVNPMLIEKPEREIAGKRAGLIPNAVRRDWISEPVRPRESPFPHDTRPVAGFLGSIFEWVDLSLLEAVARMAKEILFVLVGPSLRKSSTARLECLPNVLRFGPQPFTEVPRWLSAFDVGLIPFARGIIGEHQRSHQTVRILRLRTSRGEHAGAPSARPCRRRASSSNLRQFL